MQQVPNPNCSQKDQAMGKTFQGADSQRTWIILLSGCLLVLGLGGGGIRIGFALLALSAIIGAVIAIIVSIGRGIFMLRQTYTSYYSNPTAHRILAWNLIEPGLTTPNIIFLLFSGFRYTSYGLGFPLILRGGRNRFELLDYLISPVFCFWPMILLFVIIPLFAQRSADPMVRWAARKTAQLGIIRMIITMITYGTVGIGMVVGVPYLFWSIKKIRRWNDELLGDYAGNRKGAIVGGKSGMMVLPTDQTTGSDFKALN